MEDNALYGSTHTHFESDKDAVNAHFNDAGKISFEQALGEFAKLGAKKVAVTEHGAFNSFEDLYTTTKKVKELKDIDIIPGCEVYLDYLDIRRLEGIELPIGEELDLKEKNNNIERAHLILIAKDHEGYLQLCNLITESNKNVSVGKTKDFPIVTYEMLEEYIKGGHVVATSACIAGPLCLTLRTRGLFLKEKLDEQEAFLRRTNYFYIKEKQEEFDRVTYEAKNNIPTPAEKKALKAAKDIEGLARANTLIAESKEKLSSPEYLKLKAEVAEGNKYIKKNKLTRKINIYNETKKALESIKEYYTSKQNLTDSLDIYKRLLNIFRDDFYFELQNHHLPSEKETYNALVRFAIQVGNPRFIASNDVHIAMHKSNPQFTAEIERRKVAKFNAIKKYQEDTIDEYEYGIKTDAELREELLSIIEPYKDWSSEQIVDNAISNIKGALDKCEPFKVIKEDHYPQFANNDVELFRGLIQKGLKEKFPDGFPKGKEEEYEARLKKEMDIIESMGYASYHLIVQDYLAYGRLLGYLPADEIANAPLDINELDKLITERGYKRIGYAIGPGRGSAAGSLACYILGITDIDPIKYDLLFERFLNPERKSMPDIDSDFKKDIREKCIQFCANKYGYDNICRIMTKTYQAPKGAVRLAARFLAKKEAYMMGDMFDDVDEIEDIDDEAPETDLTKKWYKVGDNICKYIDDYNKEKMKKEAEANGETLVEINPSDFNDIEDEENPDEEEIIDDGSIKSLLLNPDFNDNERETIRLANNINGIFTATGEHACGVIISKHSITSIVPLMHNKKMDNFSTQCTMAQAEDKGLLKMDFLGLKNLDIITEVQKETGDDKLQDYSIRDEILNDPKIYKNVFCSGNTLGIFQLESPGMTKMLRDLQPDCFENIIAGISLYRPGPMDFIPQYIEGKRHPELVVYKCDSLKKILSPTYGTIVYQEQVMQIFQAVGYTLGGADAIRKAMGKKHEEEIEAERDNFIFGNEERHIDGALKSFGMTEEEATELFEVMKKFGRYAFNKSHATAYAVISLFTAYLKTYHPAEFYKWTLRYLSTKKRGFQIGPYIAEMSRFGIEMEAPSLLEGNMYFDCSKDGKKVYFGLAEGKGLSAFDYSFKTDCLQEFVEKNPDVSQTTLVSLANIGCFKTLYKNDTVPCTRKQAKEWVFTNKPKYDKLIKTRDDFKELKQQYLDTVDENKVSSLNDKEKSELFKKINTKKETYDTIIKELSLYYDTVKEAIPEPENKLLAYQAEKELCYTVFSAKEDAKHLSNCKYSFKDLEKSTIPLAIGAVVVGISKEKKTSKGNPYVNVDLMDKDGMIRVVRFKTPPNVLVGEFRVPPEYYFNATVLKSLDKANGSSYCDLKTIVNDLIEDKISIDNICDITKSSVCGQKVAVIEVDKVAEEPEESKETYSK